MRMSVSMQTRIDLQQALVAVGGLTSSIFPQAEAMLLNSADYQNALRFVGASKDMDRYESVMDFLFCELHPEWVPRCMSYYEDLGLPLRERLDAEQVVEYGERLVKALEIAYDLFNKKRRQSWTKFRYLVNQAA